MPLLRCVVACLLALIVAAAASATAQAAGRCPEYLFIGVRGSGEPQESMGSVVQPEYDRLTGLLAGTGVDLGAANAQYMASGFVRQYEVLGRRFRFADYESAAYSSSVAGGTGAVLGLVKRCKTSRLILSGYSQGAHAIMLALPAIDKARVLAVTLFGNPMFHASGYPVSGDFAPDRNGLAALPVVDPYPDRLRGRFRDTCHAKDPVCQGFVRCHHLPLGGRFCLPDFDFDRHRYGDEDVAASAALIARLIREDQAAKGNDLPEPAPVSKGPVDVAIAMDTTGSMDDVIDSVAESVQGMADQLASTQSDHRLALVAYRDGPPDCDDDYQALTVQDFVADVATFKTAVESLEADGGCDTDESVFTGAMQALGLAWRAGATKVLVMVGDAPGHDVDPVTDLTAEDVVARAQALPAAIYGLDAGSAYDTFDALAEPTGGAVFDADDADQVPKAISEAIASQASAPFAGAGGGGAAPRRGAARAAQAEPDHSGPVGAPILLSAAASYSPLGRALRYGWDFDSDGTVDEWSDDPVVAHIWPADFSGEVTLHVVDSAGQSAVTRVRVLASGVPVAAPARPARPTARAKGRTVKVRWRTGSGGGAPEVWTLRGRRGAVLAVVAASDGRRQRATLRKVPKQRRLKLRVSAINPGGESAASKPSRAIRVARPR